MNKAKKNGIRKAQGDLYGQFTESVITHFTKIVNTVKHLMDL